MPARRDLIDKYLGITCRICGKLKSSPKGLVAHRKDGNIHKSFDLMGPVEMKKELISGDYIRLCYGCHKGIHWAMIFLGMTWDELGCTATAVE